MSGAPPVPTPPTPPTVPNLAAVRGLCVGHAAHAGAGTGCTVVLAPPGGMRAACAVRGRAAGTRQMDALDPRHLVGHVDAIVLTGGSAYGLGAADGVVHWLRARGRGFPGPAGVVPIVPCAVIFDLGGGGEAAAWPTADDAARACDTAGDVIAEGSVGAGTGATVGKALGLQGAMKGGVGTWAVQSGPVVVAALVVVNAFGDVHDSAGRILAGARGADGRFVDALRLLAAGHPPLGRSSEPAENTTLAVVATNAALTRPELRELAWAGSDALARRIVPFGTALDGDVVFAVSTAEGAVMSSLQVEALAALCVPEAVERAVRLARGTAHVPGLADSA